jgi:Ran GTPase-activating protein (RanGAP) involved in mRNA processing and transport
MEVVNFDKETDESIDSNTILRYLEESSNSQIMLELSCRQVLTDQDIEQVAFVLKQDHHLQLQTLKLSKNGLTDLSAPALADILRWTAPTLRELDLSENAVKATGLQSLVEGALTLSTCRLTTLNLSNNKLDAKGAHTLAALIRGNTSIHTLHLGHNNLRHRSIKAISKSLCESSSNIRHLDLTQNKLEDRGAKDIAMALDPRSSQCQLETLNLCNNKIRSNGAFHLADAFVKGKNLFLKTLDLSDNFIEANGAEAFGVVLRFSYTLEELNLSRNNIGDQGVMVIAQGLKENPESRLKRLDLSWNAIKNEGACKLADMLTGHSGLMYLNLKSNFICDAGIQALAQSLPFHIALEELDLTGNQMRDASPLIDALCHHTTKLQRLHCEQNQLTPQEQARLEAAFTFRENKLGWLGKLLRDIKEKTQVSCNLSNRNHSDEEIIALSRQLAKYHRKTTTAVFGGANVTYRGIVKLAATVIAENTANLQRLYLKQAPLVGDVGAAALAQGLACNNTIRCLSLTRCNITGEGARMLSNALRRNSTLQRLSLEGNQIGDAGFQELCKAILKPTKQRQSGLISLNVGQNEISDSGFCNMPSIIRLDELHLDGNCITDRGALDLAKAVMGNKSLRWLNLRNNQQLSWKGVETLKMFLHTSLVLDCDPRENPIS